MITCLCLSFSIGNFPYSPDAGIAAFVILPLIIVALVAGYIKLLIKYKRKVKARDAMPVAGDKANYRAINDVNNT